MSKSRCLQLFYRGEGEDLQIWRDDHGRVAFSQEDIPFSLPQNLSPWQEIRGDGSLLTWHHESWEFLKHGSALRGSWVPLKTLESVDRNQSGLLCRSLGSFWGAFAGRPEKNVKLPSFMEKGLQGPLSQVTFFGGSFYPWHAGHRECLNLCSEEKIIVVPDTNPWKGERQQASQHDYWRYYLDVIEALSDTPYAVFPGFVGLPEGNPTVTWLPLFACPAKSFLMGADNFLKFHRWTNVESLIKDLSSLYVASRLEDETQLKEQKAWLENHYPKLEIQLLGHHPYESLSSTKLRNQ